MPSSWPATCSGFHAHDVKRPTSRLLINQVICGQTRMAVHTLSTILICFAGLINFLPVTGALSGKRIQALYGVAVEDSNSEILMRHRAVLFGIVGALIIASAFDGLLRLRGLE